MNNNNGNNLYMHRIIKIISPITCQTFKIELNGKEDEMRELLGTILEINPKSIKGLRDSFNNYYTLSSALKNPLINTDPYNYYTVVIKGFGISNDIKYIKYPSLNIQKNQPIPYERINYENKTNFLEDNDNYYNSKSWKFSTKDFLIIADELYKRNYIDKNLKKRLKQLIKEHNMEVLSILENYLSSKKNYEELAKKIKPVISSSSSSYHNSNNSKKSKKSKKRKNTQKNENSINSNKKVNLTKEESILKDIKVNFKKEQYSKLKILLNNKNKDVIKIIKKFEKDHDYNHLISKLIRLTETYKGNNKEKNQDNTDESKSISISEKNSEDIDDDNSITKKDSSDYNKEENKSSKNKKSGIKMEEEAIKKISKKIFNIMKKRRKELYYISKYDIEKMKLKEKINIFKQKFKLNIEKMIQDNNYKIPKKNITLIEKYYIQFMEKNIFKDLNEDERSIYEQLYEEDEENKEISKIYQDFLEHKDINQLQTQIKKKIEEFDKMDVEDDEDKNFIEEENSQDEEDEEDEYEEEETEEVDENIEGQDNDNEHENKDKESSSDKYILNKGDKDKDDTVKLLNTNYRKNYQYSNFAHINNTNNSENKSKDKSYNNNKSDSEEKNNDEKDKNLGLNFVVIKPKKQQIKEEEKKDQDFNYNNNNFNNIDNKDKENSVSTNTQNKKLALFISQIEHIKKVEEIKKPIIEAIHKNNKYIMELFEKFQKNKFILNKKSLYDVYNKIKENPESNNNIGIDKKIIDKFESSINGIEITEKEKEFLIYDFTTNKNSKFYDIYKQYENNGDEDDYIENILIAMKSKNIKELFVQFCIKNIKNSGKHNIRADSKEIINIIKEKELYNKKDCEIMLQYVEQDDDVFLGIFRELFSSGNLNEFNETMNLALASKKKEGNNNNKLNMEIILKNFKELKDNMEEKDYKVLDDLYEKKNPSLLDLLKDLNSTNLHTKIKMASVLILKKELSPA